MVNFSLLRFEIRSLFWGTRPQEISTGFASAPTSLTGGQPKCTIFGRLLGWYYIYIFGGSCPLTEFCQVQNLLCVQVLHAVQ